MTVQGDVAVWDDVAAHRARRPSATSGGIDVLVNNVGDMAASQMSWRELTPESVDHTLELDIKGTLLHDARGRAPHARRPAVRRDRQHRLAGRRRGQPARAAVRRGEVRDHRDHEVVRPRPRAACPRQHARPRIRRDGGAARAGGLEDGSARGRCSPGRRSRGSRRRRTSCRPSSFSPATTRVTSRARSCCATAGTAWSAPEARPLGQARRSASQSPIVGTVGPSPMCPPGKIRAVFGSPCSRAR